MKGIIGFIVVLIIWVSISVFLTSAAYLKSIKEDFQNVRQYRCNNCVGEVLIEHVDESMYWYPTLYNCCEREK